MTQITSIPPCWQCGKASDTLHVCAHCATILPVPVHIDHFAFLGLPHRYNLDAAALRQSYLELSRRFHPDRFGLKSPKERRIAVEKSARLNSAYKTLLAPLSRAEYLLAQEAGLHDLEKLRASPALLEEVMETRERILALREDGSEAALAALVEEREKAKQEETRILSALDTLFLRIDASDRSALPEIEREVVASRYNRGILHDLA